MHTTAQRTDPSFTGARLSVFGGMRLFIGNSEVDIGPPRQRVVLAMLVAARGEMVSVAELTDVLWDGDAPASAPNQIHRLVGNLRRVLQPELAPHSVGTYVTGSGNGYFLNNEGLDSDLDTFFEASDLRIRL
jgi:DNA-binding SARP family transcriptional activator